MRVVVGGLLAALCVLGSLAVVAAQKADGPPRGVLEWEARDTPAPAWTLVAPVAGVGWFGPVGSAVAFRWQPRAGQAIFYLPSPGHPSACPLPGPCYRAVVSYRWPDPDPLHTLSVLRLPDGLPDFTAQPGDPVRFQPGPGGTLRWLLP